MAIDDDLKKATDRIKTALNQLTSKSNLDPIATELAEIIRRRTRLGSGVASKGAPKEKLAPLAPLTKIARQRKKKLGKLSGKTSAGKSNLTETGQMLDAIQGKASNDKITIDINDSRTGGSIGNRKLAAIHQKGSSKLPARPFLNLAKQDIRQLTAVMQDKFSEILDKVFKK